MPEPTSTTTAAIATYAAAGLSVPVLSMFGVPLGLRVDVLVAGFSGSLVGIILLNSVPSAGIAPLQVVTGTLRRMFFALASSLTAGYLTPLALLLANLPDALLIGVAFGVGGGAQHVLASVISRLGGHPPGAPPPPPQSQFPPTAPQPTSQPPDSKWFQQ